MMNQFRTNPEQLLPGRDSNVPEAKDSLRLLNEYRSDLEFTVWYTSNSSNAPLYTASVELDGKTYTAPGLSEEMAKQQLADVIVSQIGPHIFKRLTQGLTKKTECVEPASQTQQTSHEAGRQQEDFTSNDIWTTASFGPHIFKRFQGLTKKTECVKPASQTQQTSHEAGRQQEDFTSNDDIWTMASFDSMPIIGVRKDGESATGTRTCTLGTTVSCPEVIADGQSVRTNAPCIIPNNHGTDAPAVGTSLDNLGFCGFNPSTAASSSAADFTRSGTCENKETGSDAQKSSSLMWTENDSATNHSINKNKISVLSVLKLLCPGSQFATEKTVAKSVNTDETLEEYDTTLKMDGQVFKGRSTVKLLARAYAAEAGLNKVYGLHFERSEGMPFLTGDTQKFHQIKKQIKQVTNMQKKQNKSMTDILKVKLASKAGVKKKFLELDDAKNRLSLFYELFKGQYVFHYRHDEGKRGLEHFCSLAVGGIKVERSASNQKVAKRKAVKAAVGALKANGTYDKKVAEKASQRTGRPLKIDLEQVQWKSSPLVALKNASSTVEEAPKMNATVKLMVLYPGSKCQQLSETFDEIGRKRVEVAMVVNEQTFTGIGTKPKYARAAASENALRTLGHWTSKDQKDKVLIRAAAMAKKEAKATAFLGSHGGQKGLGCFRVRSLTKNTQTGCKPLMSCTVQNFGKNGVLSQGQIWDERKRTATRGRGIHSDVLLDNNLYDTKNVAGFESTNSKAMIEPQSRLKFARSQLPTASVGTKDLNKRLMKLADGSTVSDIMSGEYGNKSNMNPEKGTYDATYDSYRAENIDSYTICDSRSEFCVTQDVDMRASFGNQDGWQKETYDATYDSYKAENINSYKICDSSEFCATQDKDMRDSFGNQDRGACSYISEQPSYPWTGHRAGTTRGHHISQYQGQRITNIAPLLKTNTIDYTGSCEAYNMDSNCDMNEFYETYNMDTYDGAYNMRDFVGVKDKGSSYSYTDGVSSYQPKTHKACLNRGPSTSRNQRQRLAPHSVPGFANPSEFPYVGGKRH